MKKSVAIVSKYFIAILIACVCSTVAAYPFLPADGDFPRQALAVFFAILSGAYILAFTLIIFATEILIRSMDGRRFLSRWSIPVFGASFPLIGFFLFPSSWWPDNHADMDTQHLLAFALSSAFALAIAALAASVNKWIQGRKPPIKRKNEL